MPPRESQTRHLPRSRWISSPWLAISRASVARKRGWSRTSPHDRSGEAFRRPLAHPSTASDGRTHRMSTRPAAAGRSARARENACPVRSLYRVGTTAERHDRQEGDDRGSEPPPRDARHEGRRDGEFLEARHPVEQPAGPERGDQLVRHAARIGLLDADRHREVRPRDEGALRVVEGRWERPAGAAPDRTDGDEHQVAGPDQRGPAQAGRARARPAQEPSGAAEQAERPDPSGTEDHPAPRPVQVGEEPAGDEDRVRHPDRRAGP